VSDIRPVPLYLVTAVDDYVSLELAHADKYPNRSPLDESGVWSLHRLVERAYASGFQDGVHAEDARQRAIATRIREKADRDAAKAGDP
jgi:hypothetical protein